MEESKAHEYYKDTKQSGSGAAQFKQGLGFRLESRPASVPHPSPPYLASHPPRPGPPTYGFSPRPPPPPPGQHSGHAPPPRAPPPMGPPPPSTGQPPFRPVPPPLGFFPPHAPGYFMPRPAVVGGLVRPPFPMPPRPPPGAYLPHLQHPSAPAHPASAAQEQIALKQTSTPPPLHHHQQQPPRSFAGPQTRHHDGAKEGSTAFQEEHKAPVVLEENMKRKGEERRRSEGDQQEQEAAERHQEEDRLRAVAEAWSAYKSDEGSVYYYNSVSGESSWEKPEGFSGNADKASSNPVPVSSEKVKGTDWLEVVCDDGKKYYYNSASGETNWQMPPEVEAKLKVRLDPVKAAMLERVRATGAQLAPEYQALDEDVGIKTGEAPAVDDVSFTEEDIHEAQPLPQPAPPQHGPAVNPMQPAAVHPQSAQKASQDVPPLSSHHGAGWAAYPPPAALYPPFLTHYHPKFSAPSAPPPPARPKGTGYGPDGMWPRDQAVAAFIELLSSKGIHAFSRWEKELPKLQPDDRFKYLPASERRPVFEEFCKDVGTVHGRAGKDGRAVGGVGGKQRKGNDRGPAASDAASNAVTLKIEDTVEASVSEGQSLQQAGFEELLDEICEACKHQQPNEGPTGNAMGADMLGIEHTSTSGAVMAGGAEGSAEGRGADDWERKGTLVRWDESLSLELLESFWGADPRWKRCPAEKRHQLFGKRMQAIKDAKALEFTQGFRDLLKEHGVSSSSRWSRTKDAIRGDKRYRNVPRNDREKLFRQYTAELKAAEEIGRAQRAQLEEKQREAQRKLDSERRAAEQRQRAAAHADAVSHYKALLKELVRDCDVTWREAQPRLARDPQGRASNSVFEAGETERLFRTHMQELLDAAHDAFLDLMNEMIQPLLPSKAEQDRNGLPLPLLRFKEAAMLLEPDQRFHRLPEDLREIRWRRYVDDIVFNRDNPKARQRTLRRTQRYVDNVGSARDSGIGNIGSVHSTGRRKREELNSGGIDKAYAREYLQTNLKRSRQDL